jgi:hypothetical protein
MLAAYRMVFGQPRQEDLLRYLLAEVPPDKLEEAASKFRIDLSPPTGIDSVRVKADFGPAVEFEEEQVDVEESEADEAESDDPILQKPPRSELPAARRDPQRAADVVTRCVPDEARRSLILGSLVEAIVEAAKVNPSSWAVTLFASGGWILRLNVGMLEVFGVHADSTIRVVVYSPRVSISARALLRANGVPSLQRYVYSSQPMATPLEVECKLQGELMPALRDAHLELIRRAARQVRKRSPYARFHSSGVVEYLRAVGYTLPS